ncbi:hypothetical protein CC86DRAFT_406368 [Ophiobolus disseminans]|uniref:Uncharacterized protein n=1 Tax=Ophiobolus disseminans TaxID=1469910 RepID=A0A6A7A2T3_9PLEO|nr:hypothetical protein CC86DRAFT_406368 [Ophiobolus disseminans]
MKVGSGRGITRSARGKAAICPRSIEVPGTQSSELDAAAQLTNEQAGSSRLRLDKSSLEDLDDDDDNRNCDDPKGSQQDSARRTRGASARSDRSDSEELQATQPQLSATQTARDESH